jgi:hypothetical protein
MELILKYKDGSLIFEDEQFPQILDYIKKSDFSECEILRDGIPLFKIKKDDGVLFLEKP